MRFAQPGARFLPLRYTELATGPARALPRHFIEVFLWQPSAGAAEWTLQWHLFEIVRDEIVRVETAVPLATMQADSPRLAEHSTHGNMSSCVWTAKGTRSGSP
jgi:hypothetical protein